MPSLIAGPIADTSDFSFDPAENCSYLYVSNSPTMYTDPSGLEMSELDFYDPALMRKAFADAFEALEAKRRQEQARLDYLRALLAELITLGDNIERGKVNCQTSGSFKFNPDEWRILRDHMKYAHGNYDTIHPWRVHLIDGTSVNFGAFPGITLDRVMFMNEKVDEPALEIFIHEPMHNLDRLGVGHEKNGLNKIIGPGTQDNYYSRYIDFLRNTKCDGESLWNQARKNAKEQLRPR